MSTFGHCFGAKPFQTAVCLKIMLFNRDENGFGFGKKFAALSLFVDKK